MSGRIKPWPYKREPIHIRRLRAPTATPPVAREFDRAAGAATVRRISDRDASQDGSRGNDIESALALRLPDRHSSLSVANRPSLGDRYRPSLGKSGWSPTPPKAAGLFPLPFPALALLGDWGQLVACSGAQVEGFLSGC